MESIVGLGAVSLPESHVGSLLSDATRAHLSEVKTEPRRAEEIFAAKRPAEPATVAGLPRAMELARIGRYISAIRHLEATNPEISRDQAKAIVDGIGYTREFSWPDWGRPADLDGRRLRCL